MRVIVKLHKVMFDKANHENGFIYHHLVPQIPPELPPPKGLVEVTDCMISPHNGLRVIISLPFQLGLNHRHLAIPIYPTVLQADPFTMPALSDKWDKASFDESKIPIKGSDHAADIASSDNQAVLPIDQKVYVSIRCRYHAATPLSLYFASCGIDS